MTANLETLIELNTNDFLDAWGLRRPLVGQGLLRRLLRPFAADFARQLLAFDAAVERGGLPGGGLTLMKHYTAGLRVAGREHIPAEGPVLILSNHPGLSDTVALFVAAARRDLRVLALERAFLRALPHTTQHLFLLPDSVSGRMPMLRSVGTYLRNGGALLTFPAGQIEPDPKVLPGAAQSLDAWSESTALFARLAPQTRIVAAIVSGVLSPAAQKNPLILWRRDRRQREFLGATLQILWKGYQNNVVHVAFAPPLLAADLLAQSAEPAHVAGAIARAARQLINRPPAGWETVF